MTTKPVKDLSYYNQGLFTLFLPNTPAGEQAWNELAAQSEGTGKVLTIQAKQCIESLRKAGYSVAKGVKPKDTDLETILSELNELLGE